MELELKYKVMIIASIAAWLALAALSFLIVRVVGWAKIRHDGFALFALVFMLVGLPAAGMGCVVWFNRGPLWYRLQTHWYHSPMIFPTKDCAMFPPNNIWNTPVNLLPVASRSSAYIASIGAEVGLHGDWGMRDAIPYNVVDSSVPMNEVSFVDGEESDPGPYRVPSNAMIENGGDGHVLALDKDACRLYEMFGATWTGTRWEAGSGAVFDLKSNALRPPDWTSSDAAGLPLLPGLVRYQEVSDGEILHALRFTARKSQHSYVWPARHRASRLEDPNVPPMGQRFRLRQDYDISGFSLQAKVILTALKTYGIMLADNGGNWYITGAPDSRWNVHLLSELRKVKGADMEAVDVSSLMVDKNSGEARY